GGMCAVPGIVSLESRAEVEYVREIIACVRRLADEQAELHEGEHDVTDVRTRSEPPVLQHEPGHHSIAGECEIPARFSELAPGDVPSPHELRLAVFQRLQHEKIGTLLEPLLPEANTVH